MNLLNKQRGDTFIVLLVLAFAAVFALFIFSASYDMEREQKLMAGCVERGFATGIRLGEGFSSSGYFACVDGEGLPFIIGDEYGDPSAPGDRVHPCPCRPGRGRRGRGGGDRFPWERPKGRIHAS